MRTYNSKGLFLMSPLHTMGAGCLNNSYGPVDRRTKYLFAATRSHSWVQESKHFNYRLYSGNPTYLCVHVIQYKKLFVQVGTFMETDQTNYEFLTNFFTSERNHLIQSFEQNSIEMLQQFFVASRFLNFIMPKFGKWLERILKENLLFLL